MYAERRRRDYLKERERQGEEEERCAGLARWLA
jgi:hypothetical protein